MTKNKKKIQTLLFNKKIFYNKRLIRNWINKNNYIIDKRLTRPIMNGGNYHRVRQKNPLWFKKSTFKIKHIAKGIKAVEGNLK